MKTEETFVDSNDQADDVWLLSIQRKLYQWSDANPNDLLLVTCANSVLKLNPI